MKKNFFTIFLFFVFFTYSINPSKAINIGDTIKKGIEKNIELAIKGKKLNEFFSGNKLTLSFEGKKKEYRFQEKKYEVFEDGKLTETGKWKVSGIFKNQIRLKAENKKKSYYFKKIDKKDIIYHFDTLPSDEKAKKTLVEIEKSSKFTEISSTTENTSTNASSSNTSSNESKDTKVVKKKKKKKKKKSNKSLNIGETLNKGISKVLGGKSTESKNNENKIQKHMLEKYRATSNVSYYFFEASINYLQSLELLYRAYDNNTEADKISSSIDYLKNSKSTESDRLKSTKSIIGTSSIKIQSSIQDASYVLSERGRGYYEQSLPFALGAAESTISLYASSKNALQTITQSGGFNIDSLLYNAKDLAAIITILPEIPDFSKDMMQTVKLIFSGAREKKIRDEGKYSKALAELNLSDFGGSSSIKVSEEEPKVEETKVVEETEEPKVEETKVVEETEEPKVEEPKVEETKVVEETEEPKVEETKVVGKKEEKTPANKKRIYKYICDPAKSEYYWGKTRDSMKLSRYEDSPYAKHMQSKGHNESFETLWQVTEIDFEEGYVYDSGSMKYDADSDGKLDTMPYAQRAKIKSHNKSQGIYISESEYNIPQEIVMEVNYTENSLEYTLESIWLAQMGVGPKYWEKYANQCIRTEYYVDKDSGVNFIKTYNDQKPIVEQAEKNLFSSQVENQFQTQTNSLFEEVNQQVLSEIGMVEDQYKNVSNNINKNKNLNNESQKFINEVSKDQLKKYKATSMITYFFFESQANYLASLELLYRAYDKNVEADKMKAQINYLKDSKSSENKRLKSTIKIIDQASNNLKNEINNENIKLSEESKVFYQKSLPFAFKATEYGYKVFVVSTAVGKDIANSSDKIGSILGNFNEVIGFASIVPKIPSYVKTIGSTSKLIFTGAKTKKIKDDKNLGDALDELDLSA